MSIVLEIRRRARLVVGPILGISLVAYFAFHLVQGDRGLMAWIRLSQDVRAAKVTLAALDTDRARLEHRVDLMRSEHLDGDMLDERARGTLNLVAPNEIVIFPKER
ncbi:MAG TPA: septum formation initiator family protein [Stellaceae bacterium]|nr:septum formation initiator family protein [Stellaceae bacterium]